MEQHNTNESPFEGVRALLAAKSVPRRRGSVWYYFGGLTLFLFGLMVVTGILLAFYYEPGAGPATTSDGSPLVAARVTAEASWEGADYTVGDIVPIPYDAGRKEALIPGELKGKVEIVSEPMTGEPLVPSAAWVSVEHTIMRRAAFGSLIRSLHSYASNFFIASLLIHMFSAFFMKAYRRPRRMLWVSGVLLLLLALGAAFTGYLLPWNRLAYFATRVGVSYPENFIPGAGALAAEIMRGGEDVGRASLTRMYGAHVTALPLAMAALVGLHLLLLQFTGLSAPAGSGRRERGIDLAWYLGGGAILLLAGYPIVTGAFDLASPYAILPLTLLPVVVAHILSESASPGREEGAPIPFYRHYIYRDFLCWLLALGILATLAIASPWSLGGEEGLPVDLTKPLAAPKGIHPEWYFLPAFQLLKILPGFWALLVMTLVGAVWFAVPFLDRGGERSPALTLLGVAVAAGGAGLLILSLS